jgi:hypothetical protein
MIVKMQRLITRSGEPMLLIYNETRRFHITVLIDRGAFEVYGLA